MEDTRTGLHPEAKNEKVFRIDFTYIVSFGLYFYRLGLVDIHLSGTVICEFCFGLKSVVCDLSTIKENRRCRKLGLTLRFGNLR
jgi:hypothetical protein